jgi:aerobic-type carbon monoxide dehydrogenase small subunit (CoxS/CutS family)
MVCLEPAMAKCRNSGGIRVGGCFEVSYNPRYPLNKIEFNSCDRDFGALKATIIKGGVSLKDLELHINGTKRRVVADPDRSLLSVLHEDLDLTGAKYGCGEGQCGSCTVLVNGQAVRSCRTIVGTVAGKKITTVEGLEQNGRLHPIQEAFIDVGAMQCGYCIPGMIMSGVGLLEKNPRPREQEIVRAMEGNVCRCGTYPRIVAAIRRASASTATRSKVQSGGVR